MKLTEYAEALDREFATLLAEVKRLQKKILANRSQRNAVIPRIALLPNEILAEIFLQFVRDFRKDLGEQSTMCSPYKWLSITQVCHHWRDVALRMPSLWTWIPACAPFSYVKVFLERSQTSLLTIYPGVASNKGQFAFDPRILDVLLQVRDRLERIELQFDFSLMRASPRYSKDFAFPRLETVYLKRISGISQGAPEHEFWVFPDAEMPQLRRMTLEGLPPEFTSSMLPETLEQLAVLWPDEVENPGVWVELLRQLPSLKDLVLWGASGPSFSIPAPPEERYDMLSLQRIDLWQDCGSATGIAHIAQSFRLPLECKVHIHGDSYQYTAPEYNFLFSSLARCMTRIVDGETRYPLSCVLQISEDYCLIRAWLPEVDFSLYPHHGYYLDQDSADLTMEQPTVDASFELSRGNPARILPAHVAMLPFTQIRHLHVIRLEEDSGYWREFLRYVDVEELVYTNGRPKILLDGLAGIVRMGDGRPCFPRLRSLTLREVKWHEHHDGCSAPYEDEPLSVTIDAMLAARVEFGMPITELVIWEPRRMDFREGKDMVWFTRMTEEFPRFKWLPGPRETYKRCLICCGP